MSFNRYQVFCPRLRRLGLILALLAWIATVPVLAAGNAGLDIVLVLDSSGSMKQNDPHRMRVQAAKMFVTLLDKRDRVALTSFSDKAYPITPLIPLYKSANETKLLEAIDKISASGQYTNIHDALKYGYEVLRNTKDKNREKIIVLMSDGKMDVGHREKDLRLLEKTLDDLTPALAKENIKVHSIAFTEASYIPLLKLAAKDTNGHFTLLKNADTIHKVFEDIFERSKQPDMLPLQQDSFIVDNNVNEITIIASKFRPNSVISLENPSGQDIDGETGDKKVRWFSAKQFDLITIEKPEPGYWMIKFSEGGNKAYIISDLKLDASLSKQEAQPGTPFEIRAFLSKNGKRVKTRSLLSNTQFKIRVTHPDGSKSETTMKDDGTEVGSERRDGIYGTTLSYEQEGLYKFEIYTLGETFDRQKTLFLTVKGLGPAHPFEIKDAAPVAAPEPMPAPEPIAAEPVAAPAKEQAVPSLHQAEEVLKPLEETELQKPLKLDEHDAEPPLPDSAQAEESSIDYTQAIIGFVLLNIALGVGLSGWHFYKKQKAQANPANKNEGIDLSTSEEPATGEASIDTENNAEENPSG